ncbi:hypothetical protein D3C86_1362170 [compost metagenome]
MQAGQHRGVARIAAHEGGIEAQPRERLRAEAGFQRHVVRRQHQRGGADALAGGKGGQRVPDHRVAGHGLVLLGDVAAGAAAGTGTGNEGEAASRHRIVGRSQNKTGGEPAGAHSIIRPLSTATEIRSGAGP